MSRYRSASGGFFIQRNAAIRRTSMSTQHDDADDLEPGSSCPCEGCGGTLDCAPPVNCSCHIDAPCSSCTEAGLLCDTCGYDTTPERPEREPYTPSRAAPGSRRDYSTTTYTANPFNSTPFTQCCGIAAIGTDRCPNCEARIVSHDDGLSERRRQVGPGNCLMCGKKRGPLGVPGNCCC